MSAQSITDAMYSVVANNNPLVFGHRGARAYAPMNTIPAFELAVDQGAHGIELDVHRTKDGHLIIVHDFTVDHTTNGSGRVVEMTLNELKALDAGSWFSPQFAGVHLPTLDEVFEAVGQKVFINVEIKTEFPDSDGIEQLVVDCINRHGLQERILISSFNPPTLSRIRALMPSLPVGYLDFQPWSAMPSDAPYEAYNPYFSHVTLEMVEACRKNNIYINVWTCNDPQTAVDLAKMGVRGIITDNPDTVLAALKANGLA